MRGVNLTVCVSGRHFERKQNMKKFLKSYRHLTALLAVVMLAIAVIGLGALVAAGLFIVGLWQLSQFAMSKPRRGVCCISGLTPEQIEEFGEVINGLKGWSERHKNLRKRWKNCKTKCVSCESMA
jgi:hypothetical protein